MKNEKGVTLLELLVTLVILSILSVISIISIDQLLSNVNEEAIILETNTIKSSFRMYCVIEDCETDTYYQAILDFDDNYFGDYLDLNHQSSIDNKTYDIVIIYYQEHTINLIYRTHEGYWYIDDDFGYKETIIDYNPFKHETPDYLKDDFYLLLTLEFFDD